MRRSALLLIAFLLVPASVRADVQVVTTYAELVACMQDNDADCDTEHTATDAMIHRYPPIRFPGSCGFEG